jgi:hypothetical protein
VGVFFHRLPQLNRKIKALNGVNFAQGAKFAEKKYIFFSAERAEKKIRLRKNQSMVIQSIYTDE